MTEQDLIHKIEWVNKRCSLKGEPLTQSQIELLMFVFADTVVNKNFDLADVIRSVAVPEWLSTQHRKDMLKELWNTPNVNDSNPRIKAIQLASSFAEEYGYKIDIKKAMEVIKQHCL